MDETEMIQAARQARSDFLAGGAGEVLEQTERPVGDARSSRGSLKSTGTAAPGYLGRPHITRDHKARSKLGGAPLSSHRLY